MAALGSYKIYQIDNQNPIPLASVQPIAFPFAGIIVRGITTNGSSGQMLSTGVVVYSSIQLAAGGSNSTTYLAMETPAAIVAAS